MNVREAHKGDAESLIRLYSQLNPDDPLIDLHVFKTKLAEIRLNPNLHLYVCEDVTGIVVSTCYLNVIDNLTRNLKPYAVIENVVTDESERGLGYGKAVVKEALHRAWGNECYKVMLLTGSKDQSTLNFYQSCGFELGQKTAFLARRKFQ